MHMDQAHVVDGAAGSVAKSVPTTIACCTVGTKRLNTQGTRMDKASKMEVNMGYEVGGGRSINHDNRLGS